MGVSLSEHQAMELVLDVDERVCPYIPKMEGFPDSVRLHTSFGKGRSDKGPRFGITMIFDHPSSADFE